MLQADQKLRAVRLDKVPHHADQGRGGIGDLDAGISQVSVRLYRRRTVAKCAASQLL